MPRPQKRRNSSLVLVTGLAFAISAPAAYAAEGWYVSGLAAATVLHDADNTGKQGQEQLPFSPEVSVPATTESDFETGFGVAVSGGYSFGSLVDSGFLAGGFRLEGEIAYRRNNIDSLTITDIERLPSGIFSPGTLIGAKIPDDGGGEISAISFMVNGFYDFGARSRIKPYLGVGAGVAQLSMNDVDGLFGIAATLADPPGGDTALTVRLKVDDDDTVFAYQFGAGVGYEISEMIILTLDYRYFATRDPKFTDDFGEKVTSEYRSHSFGVGLRYYF